MLKQPTKRIYNTLMIRTFMFLIIIGIAFADILIGDVLSLYLLYIFPIVFLSFNDNRIQSMTAATLSSLLWIIVDYQLSSLNPSILFAGIECLSRIVIFELIAFFVGAYRRTYLALENQAYHDEKTGAYNYRAFLEIGTKELSLSRRTSIIASLAYFDMDNFKAINDIYGHSRGDEVLSVFSKIVRERIRNSDLFARIGGDEFVVLFLGSEALQTGPILDLIRTDFNKLMSTKGYPTTISIGIINITEDKDLDQMTKEADKLMYKAKDLGKNMIVYEDQCSV